MDEAGNVYVAVDCRSTDFPTTVGAYDRTLGGNKDAVMFKLSSNGTSLVYSTYIGSDTSGDSPTSLKVDDEGHAYLSCFQTGTAFPTTPGVVSGNGTTAPGPFTLTKLALDGSSLEFSTYIPANAGGHTDDMWVAPDDSVYMAGRTGATWMDLGTGSYQNQSQGGSSEGFVIRVAHDGSDVLNGTFYGGTESEIISGILVTENGDVYVHGGGRSNDLPMTANAYQGAAGGDYCGFIARFDGNLTTLIASTYYGQDGGEAPGMDLDSHGNVIILARTPTDNWPVTSDAYQTRKKGGADLYIAKFDPDLEDLKYATYFGGSAGDERYAGLTCTEHDEVVITFETGSTDLPTTSDAYDMSHNGDSDIFVARFDLQWDLKYGSYLGGSGYDSPASNIFHDGNTTIVGMTNSNDYPTTTGAPQRNIAGKIDVVVTRLWTGYPPDLTPPSAPRNLTAEVNGTRVVLSWDAPSDIGGGPIMGYNIYRGPSETNLTPLPISSAFTLYIDSPVADGSTYHYAVSAFNINDGNLS
ncbi:MAG: hypothetical protein GWN39_20680, partial [Thermoplasmata archaeon]|nr:hypothetical protein [Thermoplasmata archaeon]